MSTACHTCCGACPPGRSSVTSQVSTGSSPHLHLAPTSGASTARSRRPRAGDSSREVAGPMSLAPIAWSRARWPRLLLGVVLLVVLGVGSRAMAAPAGVLHFPNLRSYTPVEDLAINHVSGQKQLAFSHHIYNAGDGPLEIRPVYDSTTNTAIGYQRIYSHDASGQWYVASEQQVGGVFTYHQQHGHYHYPFAQYYLHAVAPDGSVGNLVASSPKIGFCLSDTLHLDPTLAHSADSPRYYQETCTDPTAIRGIAVGGTDWYIPSDYGEYIDVTQVPNGVYWFRNTVDPNHYLFETSTADNDQYWKI